MASLVPIVVPEHNIGLLEIGSYVKVSYISNEIDLLSLRTTYEPEFNRVAFLSAIRHKT